MKKIILSKRLSAVAGYVRKGSRVIDVGTDHGYIPVYLAQNNIAERIYASELREGPLSRAVITAREHLVSDKIEFLLADGLTGISEDDIDTVIISGMGGEKIAAVLKAAPWVKRNGIKLILQPQSKLEELCLWLKNSGFVIRDASLAEEDGRIYCVFQAEAGESAAVELSCDELYGILLKKRDPLLPKYLDYLVGKTLRAISGMEKTRAETADPKLAGFRKALGGFLDMKGDTEKWLK